MITYDLRDRSTLMLIMILYDYAYIIRDTSMMESSFMNAYFVWS